MNYLDFDLKIERESDQYVARILRSPAGEAWTKFKLPFSELELENLVLKISHLRSGNRHLRYSPEVEAARKFGGSLFEAVFGGDVRACLRSSLNEASQNEQVGLRIKLRLQDVPELADIPWEFLFDPSFERFFTQSNITPIVRYLEIPEKIKPLTIVLPLKILVMISSPADYEPLDHEREKKNLEKALEPLAAEGKVRLEILEAATLAGLQKRLRQGAYHIFHYIGHGGFDRKAEEGLLVLEDSQKRSVPVGAGHIAALLRDHRPLRLAILNSCEGARNSRVDPFAGAAATLIQQGIPAVVAMQFEISDEAAITFSSEFYAAVAEGMPVDAAVAEARKAIFNLPNDIEWGTPVLYMRSPDGILFEVSKTLANEIARPLGEKIESSAPTPTEGPRPKRIQPKAKALAYILILLAIVAGWRLWPSRDLPRLPEPASVGSPVAKAPEVAPKPQEAPKPAVKPSEAKAVPKEGERKPAPKPGEPQVRALLKQGQLLAGSGNYAAAWSVLEQAGGIQPESAEVIDAQERLAMDWLQNVRGSELTGSLKDIADKVLPVLARGAAAGEGQRAADLLAHMGWADFLRLRQGVGGLNPTQYYRRAVEIDWGNVFAHTMWGFEILRKGGPIADANRHFAVALESKRNREFVRHMQISALLWSSNPELESEAIRVANEMRIGGESMPQGTPEASDVWRLWDIYYHRLGSGRGKPQFLAALSPRDHLATFRWLYPEDQLPESKYNLYLFILAQLQELNGDRADALASYRKLQKQLGNQGGSLVEASIAAIKRLSK